MHHDSLYIFCRPCTTTTWNDNILSFFEDGNGMVINSTMSVWTQVRPPLFSSYINSLILSNRATWDNREMVWKDAESIWFFQRGFHGRSRPKGILVTLSFVRVGSGLANKLALLWNPVTGESDEPILVSFEDVSAAAYRLRKGIKKHRPRLQCI